MSPIERDDVKNRFLSLMLELAPSLGQTETLIPGLFLYHWEEPRAPRSYYHDASLCLIGQGRKQVYLGDLEFEYDADHYLISSMDLPITSTILEASVEKPYLGLTWKIDFSLLTQLIVEGNLPRHNPEGGPTSMAVSPSPGTLLEAFTRLLNLVHEPEMISVLAPLIQKEIIGRVWCGPQGALIQHMGTSGTQGYQIAKAIEWLKEHYTESLKMDDLARMVHMSPSSFHHYFRTLTTKSPLQYQKWLRLQEARRLMLTERVDAASAAFRVGYESPSQFNREYRRLFDAPPAQDIRTLRELAPSEQVTA